MEQQLTIEMIADAFSYDITGFDCGEEALNTFLKEHLKRQHDGQILRGYALVSGDTVPRLLGYYTLSGSCFERGMLPSKTQQKKIPYQNAPSVTLGRLAIDKSVQGQGWGEMLVAHAMRVVWGASKAVGIYGLFVEALNEKAKAFIFVWGLYSSWMKIVTYCFIRPNRLNSSLLTMSHKRNRAAPGGCPQYRDSLTLRSTSSPD